MEPTVENIASKVEQLCNLFANIDRSICKLVARVEPYDDETERLLKKPTFDASKDKATPSISAITNSLLNLDDWALFTTERLKRIESLLNELNNDSVSRADMRPYLKDGKSKR